MPKKTGIAMLAVGAVLILSALLLFFHNRQEDVQAGQEAESLLANVEAVIDAQATREPTPAGTEIPGTTPTSSATPLDPEMPVVELDGYAYVGYVEIPALELKLPVMSEWDYNRLKIAPCRQFGSSRTDDLVIAAHNYQNHFGRLKDLQTGNAVIFTDMEGVINSQSLCALWIRQRPGGQKSSSGRCRSRRRSTAHLSNGGGRRKNVGDRGGAER